MGEHVRFPAGLGTLGLGTISLILLATSFTGCDNNVPSAVANKPAEPAEDAPASAASAGRHADDDDGPELDAHAVNEDGLIVLGGSEPESPDAATSDASGKPLGDAVDENPLPPIDAPEGTPTLASAQKTSGKPAALPSGANVASEADRNQQIATQWPQPQAVLFVSGQQHGYLEPCGCTGLENQNGGLIRRDTLLTELKERGWDVVPIDVGNQVRRIGRQAELKFQTTVESFKTMGYQAATLGIDDLKLSSVELLQLAGSDGLNQSPFLSANVTIFDPSFFPSHRIVDAGGRKIGITAVLGSEFESEIQSDGVEFFDPVEKLNLVVAQLQEAGCDYVVLLAHASIEASAAIARQVPGLDLVVTAGGFGEPTLRPEPIDGSSAVMVQVGVKGMYAGIVGLFDDVENPVRYQKIAISSQFKDSRRMLDEFALYQQRLEDAGFDGLGINPISHPTNRKYVGSETCGDCHTTAYEIWENSPHVHATESIVHPPNDRGGVQRHFDPECISCHVTGWNPQGFYPYDTGYLNLEVSSHLTGSGCENCHGPGGTHAAAELGDLEADNDLLLQLREQMILPLDKARDKCLECHDLDNSPDFHVKPFEWYWDQVKHYGKD